MHTCPCANLGPTGPAYAHSCPQRRWKTHMPSRSLLAKCAPGQCSCCVALRPWIKSCDPQCPACDSGSARPRWDQDRPPGRHRGRAPCQRRTCQPRHVGRSPERCRCDRDAAQCSLTSCSSSAHTRVEQAVWLPKSGHCGTRPRSPIPSRRRGFRIPLGSLGDREVAPLCNHEERTGL